MYSAFLNAIQCDTEMSILVQAYDSCSNDSKRLEVSLITRT